MSCTKEEIERKRLAALKKRQNNCSISSPQKKCIRMSTQAGSPSAERETIKVDFLSSNSNFHPYARNVSSTFDNTKVVTATLYLICGDRFEVNPSEFCTPLINIFKKLPSKIFDFSTKLWNFSIDDYNELMKLVAPLAPYVVIGALPSYVLKVLQSDHINPDSIDLTPIEATLRHKLMPFQEDGVRFGISRRGRCMIADDMGLGKTFQALAIASYYRHNWPLLIVTTSSMRDTWQSKIHELLPSLPMMNIATLTTGKDAQLVADRQTEVVIVSYKITSMHTDLLKNKKFGVVIIDESHYLKSHKAQCTIALNNITRGSDRIILLSGTPALSRPSELYTQLALIEPKLFGSYTEYGKRYCAGKQTNFGWDMSGQSNLAELQVILQKRFLIRRTKEQVLTKLEAKTRETVILDDSLLQYSKEDEHNLSDMAQVYGSSRASDRHAALLTFFSQTAKVKIPAICKYIKQVLREDGLRKFLVFAHHRNVIEAVCSVLDEERTHYICIVGATPTHTRAELVEKFQHSATCVCGVLSLTAAGAGLTLTAADLVIFAELHWNPGILTQAEARAHRIGQSRGVRVRYLLATATADQHMWPLLRQKLAVLNDVGLSKDSFSDAVTKHQESKNSITQYLSPSSVKNRNDYIPGTNILKGTLKSDGNHSRDTEHATDNSSLCGEAVKRDNCDNICEQSFLEDDEDDELLANLDL
ncbi:hypothetical protein ACJJTC_012568 [Scirpophaga incertulas]